jgi:EAL domain-containing protein (putative c-di-GMP-specific phosphodiesterase class I)
LRTVRAWRAAGIANSSCTLNVHVSSQQFSQPDLLDVLRGMLVRSGFEAGWVRLEITVSALAERSNETSALLKQIRALDIEIQIGDVGVDYSSPAARDTGP